jgi:GT2 family glycosyltransferase
MSALPRTYCARHWAAPHHRIDAPHNRTEQRPEHRMSSAACGRSPDGTSADAGPAFSRKQQRPRWKRNGVTVVIPAFNAEKTIAEALNSVMLQTVPPAQVIVVDDGSTDNTRLAVAPLMLEHGCIEYVFQSNAGPAAARNKGVSLATAELIALLDADDKWLPAHLETHLCELAKDPKLGLSFSRCQFMTTDGRKTPKGTRVPARSLTREQLLASNPAGTCSGLVFRKEVWDTAGPMRTDMRFAEDQEWLFRVAHKGWPIRGTAATTVLYRLSPSGLSCQVDRMMAGWEYFLSLVRMLEPGVVARHEHAARAWMSLYCARQCIRSKKPVAQVVQHMATAVASVNRMAFKNAKTWFTSRGTHA